MENIVKYSINITMEAMMILILMALLLTCFWQKKRFLTTKPLLYLTCAIILTLAVQIVKWSMLMFNVPAVYNGLPIRIIYIVDYFLAYSIGTAFYFYVEALAKDGYRDIGDEYVPKKKINRGIFIWGILTTLIYAALLLTLFIYRIEQGMALYTTISYVCLHIAVKYAFICALVLIIRQREFISTVDMAISISFIIIASVVIITDEIYGFCFSYVLLAISTFVLYVRIDLIRGTIIEKQEKDNLEWKTQIMISQIQPHFLYNVLTTISGLCEMQNAIEARDVVIRFADYYRINLDSLGKEKTISFEKELEHIKTYLWLEKIRFEDIIHTCYDIEISNFMVPALSIQPLVENALKHGILPNMFPGTITIKSYQTETDYVITIKDDGVGFDPNEIPRDGRTHVGIRNVKQRLEIICNGTCEIHSDKGVGTVVTVRIPKGEQCESINCG